MLMRAVICCSLLVLVGANVCPDGGRCKNGQTCCSDPRDGYQCCPFFQAECCEDHVHCCPEGTNCDTTTSRCLNATGSMSWVQRTPAQRQQGRSKSFRMINSHRGPSRDHVCPDGTRCPPEFSCLRSLSQFVCCPSSQGVACSDGKHCCPDDHLCSQNGRSCIKKESASAVICKDGVSECPADTTCCERPDGSWGCCPMPQAVCCEDKVHCCNEGTTCDLEHLKCISLSTKEETPMRSKVAARRRAEWHNQKNPLMAAAEGKESEKVPELTEANSLPHLNTKDFVSFVAAEAAVHDVACNESVGCSDDQTCCKTRHGWSCCPFLEAVCCSDLRHCCPKGLKCSRLGNKCIGDFSSVPLVEGTPTIPEGRAEVGVVPCDAEVGCPDNQTCCTTSTGDWSCCPLPKAVCCKDHIHCCPKGTTCNLPAQTCDKHTASTAMKKKVPALTLGGRTAVVAAAEGRLATMKQDRNGAEEEKKKIQCDPQTTCPPDTTCCFIASEDKWGCCGLPKAVCCRDMKHCCPSGYTCTDQGSCVQKHSFPFLMP